ncbi:MAG: Wzz/FepE/Etk N-terminal domain-containing protein, partial [Bacteroidetes bacterium]|nr:Wzz/FepE/Etk N-terminal domain-containing protein [Bacteroidota bacterium]
MNQSVSNVKASQKIDRVTPNNLKEYLGIIRSNLLPIILIFITSIIITIVYVVNTVDIYKTTATLKIAKPQGSILTTSLMPEAENFTSDRYILNEIEILKSYSLRENIADALIDTIKKNIDQSSFFYLRNIATGSEQRAQTKKYISEMLSGVVSINQKRGLDIVEIEVQSPSNLEAVLIADEYANTYQKINLEFSRRELTTIREFLAQEKEKKFKELANSEASIQDYQQKGGIIFLDDQAKKVVEELSTYQAQKSATEVDLFSKQKAYSEIQNEISKVDLSIVNYIEGHINEPYISELQKKIAEIEIQKDVENTIPCEHKLKEKVEM